MVYCLHHDNADGRKWSSSVTFSHQKKRQNTSICQRWHFCSKIYALKTTTTTEKGPNTAREAVRLPLRDPCMEKKPIHILKQRDTSPKIPAGWWFVRPRCSALWSEQFLGSWTKRKGDKKNKRERAERNHSVDHRQVERNTELLSRQAWAPGASPGQHDYSSYTSEPAVTIETVIYFKGKSLYLSHSTVKLFPSHTPACLGAQRVKGIAQCIQILTVLQEYVRNVQTAQSKSGFRLVRKCSRNSD